MRKPKLHKSAQERSSLLDALSRLNAPGRKFHADQGIREQCLVLLRYGLQVLCRTGDILSAENPYPAVRQKRTRLSAVR